MKPLGRATSQRKIISQQSDVSPDIKRLTNKSKDLYRPFNLQPLQMSRLAYLKGYQQLLQELVDFNKELVEWKKDKHQIRNLVVTYHLYENLYSRIRFISVFSNKQEEALSSINSAIEWFAVEKPSKRNFVPNIQPELKARVRNPEDQLELKDLVQTNTIKREMKVFQIMARTAHSDVFPPRERLKDYRRKEFAPVFEMEKDKAPMTAANTTASTFKFKRSYRDSLASRSSFKDTKTTFKLDDKKDSVPENDEVGKLAEVEEQREDEMREKIVGQQQIAQQSIIPQDFEEDQPDKQDMENLESEEEEEPPKELRVKKYARDHDPDEQLIAEERIKENQQSTIRRIIKHKEEKIRIKIEQLEVKRHMNNWAMVASKRKAEESKKLEKMLHVNKYRDMQHRIIDPHSGRKNNENQPRQIPMLYRSKSSHPGSIQSEVQKIKIQSALKTYGRYLQHGNFKPIIESEEEQEILRKYRGSSLTSHAERITKKKYLGDILTANNHEAYNLESENMLMSVKQSLSAKNIAIPSKNIFKATSVPPLTQLKEVQMYRAGSSLPSNPYFPKHLYQSKPKKKKKK